MTDLIIKRSHGFQLDHIGLGVSDTRAGVEWVQAQTGAKVDLHDPEPGQWYWSGSLAIGESSFLEIIGPNPNVKSFHPFGALLKTLTEPQLLFWYIAVTDFKAFQTLARTHKGALERVEAINIGQDDAEHASYHRGYIGPGFMSERPNVIEWLNRPNRETQDTPACRLTDFWLSNPAADAINPVFSALGSDTKVAAGPSAIGVTIETPKGAWSLENPGIKWTMPSMLFEIAGLWWRTRNM